ncbi:MAG: hypothetical protein ACRD3S_05510 [Terracidiphilus sp.]
MIDRAIEERSQRGCLPERRRAYGQRANLPLGPNAPLVAALLSQRIPGGHGHEDEGVREEAPNNVRKLRPNCAIVAIGDPRAAPQIEATKSGRSNRAAIPSLRAHKLIPARRDPLGTMPAIFL